MTATGATATGTARAPIEHTWRVGQPIDPVGIYPRFGPLPAVVAVEGQSGDWRSTGQSRTLRLSDGGSVVERTEIVDAPRLFAYELSDFTGLFSHLVGSARAEWTFTSVEGGTRVDWSYEFRALRGRTPIVAAIVRLFWAPYMRRVLPAILAAVEARS